MRQGHGEVRPGHDEVRPASGPERRFHRENFGRNLVKDKENQSGLRRSAPTLGAKLIGVKLSGRRRTATFVRL